MESVNKLEVTAAKWYEKAPHLPANGRKWLSENVWWIALVGVILSVFAVFGLFSLLFLSGAVLIGVGGALGAAVGGIIWFAALVSLVFTFLQLILTAVAISPLKNKQKKGWTLLFIVTLLNVVAAIIGFLMKFNIFDLVWSLILVAVGAYFLFEIRSSFVTVSTAKKPVAAKAAPKKA